MASVKLPPFVALVSAALLLAAAGGARAELWTKTARYFSGANSSSCVGAPDWVQYHGPAALLDCEPQECQKDSDRDWYFVRTCNETATDEPTAPGVVYLKWYDYGLADDSTCNTTIQIVSYERMDVCFPPNVAPNFSTINTCVDGQLYFRNFDTPDCQGPYYDQAATTGCHGSSYTFDPCATSKAAALASSTILVALAAALVAAAVFGL